MGNWGLLENVNHRHGAQAEHSFLKNHRLLKYSELVCNSENCWPRESKAECRNGLEKWNKTQGAFVMPEGFAEWGLWIMAKPAAPAPLSSQPNIINIISLQQRTFHLLITSLVTSVAALRLQL